MRSNLIWAQPIQFTHKLGDKTYINPEALANRGVEELMRVKRCLKMGIIFLDRSVMTNDLGFLQLRILKS